QRLSPIPAWNGVRRSRRQLHQGQSGAVRHAWLHRTRAPRHAICRHHSPRRRRNRSGAAPSAGDARDPQLPSHQALSPQRRRGDLGFARSVGGARSRWAAHLLHRTDAGHHRAPRARRSAGDRTETSRHNGNDDRRRPRDEQRADGADDECGASGSRCYAGGHPGNRRGDSPRVEPDRSGGAKAQTSWRAALCRLPRWGKDAGSFGRAIGETGGGKEVALGPNPREDRNSGRGKLTFVHWRMPTRDAGEIPLVGRSAELALLSRTMDEAAKGAGSSVFITGEGGIGKTRLAMAAAERATKKGWSVAVGRAYPVETGVPYALFSDAFLPLVSKLEPASMALLTRGGASDFGNVFPYLSIL